MRHMPMSDKKYEENDYARTLSEAAAIKADKKMMKMAKTGAKRMAKEKMAEAKAMKRIAGTKITKRKKK